MERWRQVSKGDLMFNFVIVMVNSSCIMGIMII